MIKLIIFIILYHVIFHNNLEKMLCHTYFNYKNTKRPLDECNNFIESLRCIGMPSGHAEIITIISFLLFKNKYISIEIAVLLVILFSSQRIISNMHTLNQVLVGIFLGFVYGNIYNKSNYSIFIIIIIGFICACLTIIKKRKNTSLGKSRNAFIY